MATSTESLHIALLGCGFMGTAIVQGLIRSQKNNTARNGPRISQITACVRSDASAKRLQAALSPQSSQQSEQALEGLFKCVVGISKFAEAAKEADVVILGVPPDQLDDLCRVDGIMDAFNESDKVIISLLAGVSCSQIQDQTVRRRKASSEVPEVLRVIPTIAANLQDSVTLFASSAPSSDPPTRPSVIGKGLFSEIGSIIEVPEHLMNTATAAGAATNALAIVALDGIVDRCVAEGLPRDMAMALAAQSLRSAAGLVSEGGMTPESVREAMSVPRGITINSVLQLEKGGVRPGISDAVKYAIDYANGMSS